ncbi:CAAX prenyl protease [Gonapodya sp. JEL0774]|nr:CAAX prenyl protease [Gonapodya sp. JEL0774]
MLYLGPIVQEVTDYYLDDLMPGYEFGTLRALRDYLVGPAAEEFIFRSCMVPLALAAGWSQTSTVLLLPTVFGVAHLHHLYERYNQGGRSLAALKQASVVSRKYEPK